MAGYTGDGYLSIKGMKMFRLAALAFLTLSCFAVEANDVTDAINNASKHYQAGELTQAAAQLDYAATLIRQQKAAEVVKAFPDAPTGWQARDADTNVAAGAVLGGGISVSRNYYNDQHSIDIEMLLDSPMLQAFTAMLSNPSVIVMSGGKLVKVQGLNAVQKTEGDQFELQFVTHSNAMITLRGDTAAQSVIEQLANAINLKQL
jgi:hypothetical protein